MLTITLRKLERDGLVSRTVHPGIPLHVEYGLIKLGRTLCDPLDALSKWAATHMASVKEARVRYDRAHDGKGPVETGGQAGAAGRRRTGSAEAE
jgi:DNA-binding HxlR family transcriptional regulator